MQAQNTTRMNERGFTLVEILIAMTMSLVVMGAIYSLFTTQQKSYLHQERVATIQQNLRSAMIMIERDVRLAGCNPTGTISPKPGIVMPDSNATTIHVTMDITNATGDTVTGSPDGDINDPNEDVTYTLVGTNLMRNIPGNNNNVVAEYIQSLNFTYLDGNGNVTAVSDNIRSVQVTIVAQTQKGQITSRTLTSNIKCRNLGLRP
jgi:type IV pilus assembly protein PilW